MNKLITKSICYPNKENFSSNGIYLDDFLKFIEESIPKNALDIKIEIGGNCASDDYDADHCLQISYKEYLK